MFSMCERVRVHARIASGVMIVVAVTIPAAVSQSWGVEPQIVRPTLQLTTSAAKDQDDACIWVHPKDGAQSVVIASDKTGGNLVVYDLQGRVLQQLAVAKPGNIDLRQNVKLSGFAGDLVVVNQRSGGFRLQVYKVDPVARTLERIDCDRLLTGPNYGGCLQSSFRVGSTPTGVSAIYHGHRSVSVSDRRQSR